MKDVDHEDRILKTFILFVQTADVTIKYANAHFYRKEGLSVTKYMVLQILAFNGGTMKPSEIADWTSKERHNITTLVERLKQEGLVRTERSNRDKRFINVALTAKGRKVLKQITPVASEIVNQVMSSIAEGDVALLEKQLRVLRQNAHHGFEGFANHPRPQPS